MTSRPLALTLNLPAASVAASERPLLARALASMVPDVLDAVRARLGDQARRVALAYAPEVEIRRPNFKMLEMQKTAAEAVLQGSEWMTAEEVGRLAKRSPSNRAALANRWKREGKVFAVNWKGKDWFPRYAFDGTVQPQPVMGILLKTLGASMDPWRIAAWFESSNGALGGRRPREVMDSPDALIAAASRKGGLRHG
ncbi:MAG: hypothetical protein ACKVQK_09225 [Burkholderiales bacterium]